MIANGISFILANLPSILTLIALIIALALRGSDHTGERRFGWLLLLAVGIDGLWAGFFHIFFPQLASAQIGWSPSPFETEIGIADFAMGVVAVIAFWNSLSFKCAIALYAIVFYVGAAIGHVHDAIVSANFAPDNFGPLLIATLLRTGMLVYFLIKTGIKKQ